MVRLYFCGLLILLTTPCIADYRAFELEIRNRKKKSFRKVITTLDHIQYPDYHPLEKGENIFLSDSWRCWHNASHFQDICPNPKKQKINPAKQKPKT